MNRFAISCLLTASFLTALGALSPASHASQASAGTVTGVVLDSNRAPLPEVSVRLLNESGASIASAVTDAQGRFQLPISGSGSYKVTAALTGFETATVDADTGKPVELTLAVAPVRESIVVTATRTEIPTSETGISTTVIGKEEIVDRQALDVSELLQSTPSAQIVSSGGLGTVTSLFVRGGNSNYNKVLLDGIPINEPGGAFDFSNLTAENLDRVEVVRGPQSALFGSDAMTSVVQLFTAHGEAEGRQPHFSFSAEGGENDTWRTQAGLSGASGPFDYSLDWARLSTDNQAPNNVFENSTLSGNFGLKLGADTDVRLILRGDLGRTGAPGQTAFEPAINDASYRRGDGFGGFTLHNRTTPSWDQRFTYTFAETRWVSRDLGLDPDYVPQFEGSSAPFAFSDFASDTLNDVRRHHASYQSDLRIGSIGSSSGQHTITFAFDWDRELGLIGDRLSSSPLISALRDNFGWTLQDQALWRRVSFTNSMRVDDNGSFGTSVVPRSSLAYFLRRDGERLGATKLKFNFGLGIDEPSFTESFSPPPYQGNPNLQPERVRSFDFGVEQRAWGDRAKVELNWFDNRFRDQIAFMTTNPETFAGTYFNLGRAKAKGAEAIAEISPLGKLRLHASYTFLDSEITQSTAPTTPGYEVGQPLLRRPRHSGDFQILWDWRRLNITSTAVLVGRRSDSDFASLVPPLTSNPGYARWDLAWSYRTSYHISYFGVAENLLNKAYMDPLGYPALKFTYRAGLRVQF